jgi:ribosome-binding protein aMBF1 (putative translation factor)
MVVQETGEIELSPRFLEMQFIGRRCYVRFPQTFVEVAGRKAKNETNPKPTIDLDKSFGPNLKFWREKRGYSQERLAELAEIDRREVGRLENGQREPRFGIINKLAGALEIEPGELFKGTAFTPAEVGKGHFTYDPYEPSKPKT